MTMQSGWTEKGVSEECMTHKWMEEDVGKPPRGGHCTMM